ncbi:hypothetical protein BC567DRAFT_56669 [Phyllosticta citribraziliensis]
MKSQKQNTVTSQLTNSTRIRGIDIRRRISLLASSTFFFPCLTDHRPRLKTVKALRKRVQIDRQMPARCPPLHPPTYVSAGNNKLHREASSYSRPCVGAGGRLYPAKAGVEWVRSVWHSIAQRSEVWGPVHDGAGDDDEGRRRICKRRRGRRPEKERRQECDKTVK